MIKQKAHWALLLFLAFATLTNSCKKKNDELPSGNPGNQLITEETGKPIHKLADEYFNEHEDEEDFKEQLIKSTTAFLAQNNTTVEFGNKRPCKIQPIYAYGIDGVAYYEIWFTEDDKQVKGWLLVSTTDHDLPIVNFSQGTPYSSRLIDEHMSQDAKVYRFGPSYFVLENNGTKMKEYGQMPTIIFNTNEQGEGVEGDGSQDPTNQRKGNNLREGLDYFTISDYETLKDVYSKYYYSQSLRSAARVMSAELQSALKEDANARIANDYTYRWVSGQFCYFTQIAPNTGHNNTNCFSGCNNNAWANLYGWWDFNRGKGSLIPTTSTGETSPRYRNTLARQNSVDPVQMQLRALAGTFCSGTSGNTYWSSMHLPHSYAGSHGYEYYYRGFWCWFSGCNAQLADVATEGIANDGTPVIIGANSHMYLGYGWAQMPSNLNATWVYCYPGWREDDQDNLWIHWSNFNASTRLRIH